MYWSLSSLRSIFAIGRPYPASRTVLADRQGGSLTKSIVGFDDGNAGRSACWYKPSREGGDGVDGDPVHGLQSALRKRDEPTARWSRK